MNAWVRYKAISAAIIVIAALVIYGCSLNAEAVLGSDTAVYLNLATSLSHGHGYVNSWLTNTVPQTKFPFLFPLLLSPWVYFFGINFLRLKIIMVVLGVAVLVLFYRLLEKQGEEHSPAILFLVSCSAYLFVFSHTILSEIPYLFFSLLAMLFMMSYQQAEPWSDRTGRWGVIFLIAAYFTRTIGVCLAPAAIITMLSTQGKRGGFKKNIFLVATTGAAAVAWTLRNYLVGGRGYAHYFFVDKATMRPAALPEVILSLLKNGYALFFYVIPGAVSGIRFEARSLTAVLISAGVLTGFIVNFRRKRTILEWYVLAYISVLLLWPWVAVSGQRFIVPLLQFLLYYFYCGVRYFVGRIENRIVAPFLLTAVTLCVAITNLSSPLRFVEREYQQEEVTKAEVKNFTALSSWLAGKAASDARLLSFGAGRQLYLLSGRKSVDDGEGYDANMFWDKLRRTGVDYVVVDAVFGRQTLAGGYAPLLTLLREHPEIFRGVYAADKNYVFQVDKIKLERFCGDNS
ncbi:MAG: hypothetical protein PHO30_04865 [Candidatus Omnitrophica bacterium]|nr:hypothetical protein [Candidatus Omnitrophota bacterium]